MKFYEGFFFLPGFASEHPIPQLTMPDWKYCSCFPGIGQTNGLPPSPLHVSLPGSPPVKHLNDI